MGDFFSGYEVGEFFDEMFSSPGVVRPHYGKLLERFKEMERAEFERKRIPGQDEVRIEDYL